MKKFFSLLTFILFLFSLGFSVIVKVDVKEVCSVEVKSLNVSLEKLPKLDAEIYNSGSLPYSFRISIEGENRVWSEKIFEAPGDLKRVSLYFLPSNETKMKIYFCNKIFEKKIEASEKKIEEGKWFFISKARAYSSFLVLEVVSNVSSEVALMPFKYPENWVIENYVGKLKVGKNYVKVNYESEVVSEKNVSFVIASVDGNYLSKSEVKIEKRSGLEYWLFYLLDNIRIWIVSKF